MRFAHLFCFAVALLTLSACARTSSSSDPMSRAILDWQVMRMPVASNVDPNARMLVGFMALGDADGFKAMPLPVGETMALEPITGAEASAIEAGIRQGKYNAIGANSRIVFPTGETHRLALESVRKDTDPPKKSGFRLEFLAKQDAGEAPRLSQFALWRSAGAEDILQADLSPELPAGLYRLSRPVSLSSNSAGRDEHFLIIKVQSIAAAP